MTERAALKCAVLGVVAAVMLVLLVSGTRPARAVVPLPFPGGALPPLLTCPDYNGSDDNQVTVADITAVISRYHQDYPSTDYWYLYDSMGSGSRGLIRSDDVAYVVGRYRNICPALDTQIAKAAQAIGNPSYADKLCDEAGNYTSAVNCGGDPQFFTEDPAFLLSKGYKRGSTDVPGQGIHYVNFAYWNGVFNPVRPPGLVYKSGHLVAQLYYAAGDSGATLGGDAGVGWGSDRTHNVRAVDLEALPCTTVPNEPASVGSCSWAGSHDGWHWHANLCTVAIGTPAAIAIPGIQSQQSCNQFGSNFGTTCTFPETDPVNFNCAWAAAVGWMGHLWDWYPNANLTNAVNPGPGGYNDCQAGLCATGESNGRFADCSPDSQSWTAYNCPQ